MKYTMLVFSIGMVLAQTISPAPGPVPVIGGVPDFIAHGGIVGIVLWFSRQDRADRAAERVQDRADRAADRVQERADRAAERLEQEKRYSDLAQEFRRIVTDNTAAMTTLQDVVIADRRPAGRA